MNNTIFCQPQVSFSGFTELNFRFQAFICSHLSAAITDSSESKCDESCEVVGKPFSVLVFLLIG